MQKPGSVAGGADPEEDDDSERRSAPAKTLGQLVFALGIAGRLKILLDTNIYVPLEPTSCSDLEANSTHAFELARRAAEVGHALYLHPEIRSDIARDRDGPRQAVRTLVLGRYPTLQSPPSFELVESELGVTAPSENDRVDHWFLAAVFSNAVDCLVTEDNGIHRKARRLGVSARVLRTADALDLLRSLHDTTPEPPPHVRVCKAYNLDVRDPFFDTLRGDYAGAFESWLQRAALDHRPTWVIDGASGLAALAIMKRASEAVPGVTGQFRKICTFKVAEAASGIKFGELLLKTLFQHAYENHCEGLFLTVFQHHDALITLLKQFGFEHQGTQPNGELVMVKRLIPTTADLSLDPLEFQVRFGPHAIRSFASTPAFYIPIQPHFHDALFPEAAPQKSLAIAGPQPFGSAMRKAYLCHAKIDTSRLVPGANLFFYRSVAQHLACTGVLEGVMRSASPRDIAKFVTTRTVYSYSQIQKMCDEGEVLALLFRHSRTLAQPISRRELNKESVLSAWPQSIVSLKDASLQWFEKRLGSH